MLITPTATGYLATEYGAKAIHSATGRTHLDALIRCARLVEQAQCEHPRFIVSRLSRYKKCVKCRAEVKDCFTGL